MPRLEFVLPGDPTTATGGFVYDRKVNKGGFFQMPDMMELFLYLELPAGTDLKVTSETLARFEEARALVGESAQPREGRSRGQEASVLAVSGIPLGRWGIILGGIGPRWLSQNRVDYYYGVRAAEARPGRPAYRPSNTWNLDINVTALISLGPKWSLVSVLNREGFGSSIKNSPIVERSSAWGLVTALSYNF